jgi:DNA-binding response OmpR family regulator
MKRAQIFCVDAQESRRLRDAFVVAGYEAHSRVGYENLVTDIPGSDVAVLQIIEETRNPLLNDQIVTTAKNLSTYRPELLVLTYTLQRDINTSVQMANSNVGWHFNRIPDLQMITAIANQRLNNVSTLVESTHVGKREYTLKNDVLYSHERSLRLTIRESRLMGLLLSHPNQAITRAQILDTVWPGVILESERAVDILVSRLRRKLIRLNWSNAAHALRTANRIGYYFCTQDESPVPTVENIIPILATKLSQVAHWDREILGTRAAVAACNPRTVAMIESALFAIPNRVQWTTMREYCSMSSDTNLLVDVACSSYINSIRYALSQKPTLNIVALSTVDNRARDLIQAIHAGVLGIISGPVDSGELVAWFGWMSRRRRSNPSETEPTGGTMTIGGRIQIDTIRRIAWLHGQKIPLTNGAFDLLQALTQYSNRVVPRQWLEINLCSPRDRYGSRALDIRVSVLRKILKPFSTNGYPKVATVRGIGYALLLDENAQAALRDNIGELTAAPAILKKRG